MAHAKIPAKIDADELLDTLSRNVFEGMTCAVHIEIEIGHSAFVADSVEEAAELIKRLADDRRKARREKAAQPSPTNQS